MLSKISQTAKNKYCMISLICVILKNLIAIQSRLVVPRGKWRSREHE